MEVASTKSDRHLPEDLLHEILRRLPVKSLFRFRCVSKPRLALVDDDADFARLHLDTFKNNRDQTRLFVVEGRQRDCTVRCADTFESLSEIPWSLDVDERRGSKGWKIVSSVDGLVLLELHDVLKLWNPSLRHFRTVPPAPIDVTQGRELIGLGYDPVGKDYKIVMLIEGGSVVLPSIAIYSVGTDSWKTIALQGKEGSSCSERRLGECMSEFTVYLHGSLYFFAWARGRKKYRCCDLIAFDLSKEVYSCISTPCELEFDDNWNYYEFVLIDGGSSLALWDRRGKNKFIWVLERESMNWTRRELCDLKIHGLLCGKKNGDMLTTRWITDAQEWNEEVASYSPAKHEYKIIRRTSYLDWITHASFYVESLILNKLNRV